MRRRPASTCKQACGLLLALNCIGVGAEQAAQWGDPPTAAQTAAAATQSPLDLRKTAKAALEALKEVAADLVPDGRPAAPSPAALSAPRSLRPSEARAARISELPALLGVASTLPLDAAARHGQAAPSAATSTRPVNLQLAMELGLAHSLDVQAAAARLESFEQTALAAQGALQPHMDGRAAAGTGWLETVQPHENRHRKEGSLTLKQPLLDLPAARELRRQSLLADSSRVQWQAAVSNANLQVATAYLQALQARLALELGVDYERRLGELLTHVSARAEAGGTSKAERDRVRARVANARSQMADSRATLQAALRTLETLIGETPAHLAIGAPPLLAVPLSTEDALGEARVANRELVAARTEVAATALEASSQRGRFAPRVEFELSHTRATNAAGTVSYARDTKAMVVLTWSLLNGGTDLAQSRAAAARMREKQLRADDQERVLDQELSAIYASLDAVNERYSALREELAANRTVVDAFQAQLVGGNRPLLDVLDAYQRLHQSRLDLSQLVVSEVQNHLKVAHLTGRLSTLGEQP
jgi:adhesin transport system outer membrane protein